MVQPRFEQGRAMLLAGLRRRHRMAEMARTVPQQWGEFMAAPRPPGQVGPQLFGAICSASEMDVEYMCAVEVASFDALPPEAGRMRVPAARYAVFTHDGHMSAIGSLWQRIWTEWLPTSGEEDGETPSFEYYGERFDPSTGTGAEIWFPVKRRA